VRTIGVQQLYPERLEETSDPERAIDLAVLSFRADVSIRPVVESSVIKVGFEHASPEIAARAVNLLLDRFGGKHLEVFGEERSDALQAQMVQREAKLGEAEELLAEFKASNSVFNLAEQGRLLLSHRIALEDALRASELELSQLPPLPVPDGLAPTPVELPPHLAPGMMEPLLRELFELEGELRALEKVLPDQLMRDASLRLLDLELEETELLRDYSATNRKVQCVRAEIERVREFLATTEKQAASDGETWRIERGEKATDLRSRIAALRGDIELLVKEERQRLLLEGSERRLALDARCDDLRKRRAGIDSELRSLDALEKGLGRLERERAAAAAALEACRARVEEARLSEGLDREKQISVRVIEEAVPPVIPSGLSRTMKLALGGAAGLLAGLAAAVLSELLRSR
jgi:uncharacterized protein involved in exopolysaccharide biosynthesis